MKAEEYIIPINETAEDYDEMFVGVIRRQPVLIRCENCPHSKEWVEQARQWTVWCEHFDMSTPRDWFCAIPVREKEGKENEV